MSVTIINRLLHRAASSFQIYKNISGKQKASFLRMIAAEIESVSDSLCALAVKVCKAMHHGGSYPATTDSRFTSVGNDVICRFVRPISFQNAPVEFLPAELQNNNPLNISCCVNNVWKQAKL